MLNKYPFTRHILKTVSLILGLVGLLWLSLHLWLYTLAGAKFSVGVANTLTPYTISYETIEGTLATSLSFDNLQIQHQSFELTIKQIDIQWKPKALLKRILSLPSVVADGVTYKPIKTTTDSQPISLEDIKAKFSSPNSRVKVQSLTISHILIDTEVPFSIDKFNLSKVDSNGKFLINTMTLEGPFGHIFIHGDDALKVSFDLSIPDLSQWSNRFKGDFKGHGTLSISNFDQWLHHSYLGATLESNFLQIDDVKLSSFSFKTKGTLDKFKSDIKLIFKDHKISIPLTATYQDNQWQLDVKSAQVIHPMLGALEPIKGYAQFKADETISGHINLTMGQNQLLEGQWSINPTQQHALDGLFRSHLKDLNLFAKLLPSSTKVHGSMDTTIELDGNLEAPIIQGHMRVRDIDIAFTELGTQGKINQLEIVKLKSDTLKIDGSGTLGDGQFQISGTSDLTQDLNLKLQLVGQQLTLSDNSEFKIIASPSLAFDLNNGIPKLSGQIYVDNADLKIRPAPSTIELSPDVVIVESKTTKDTIKDEQSSSFMEKIWTDLQLTLGDVRFRGYGLDSKLEGSLLIHKEPNHLHKATGKIFANQGTYKTHGKQLVITKAQLVYADAPLSNPSLDFKAHREITQFESSPLQTNQDFFNGKTQVVHEGPIKVGVTLQGTVRAPILKLYSSPSLPEGDILSYLILDKPQKSASITEGKLLFAAANELIYQFGNQTDDIRPSIAEQFKLDKLEIQSKPNADGTTGLEEAALVFGKQFTDKIYVEYSHVVMDAAKFSVNVRYMISNHITLETSASKDSISSDLLFIFESG